MSIQIEVSESHITALVEFYIQRLKVLREEIQEREKESKEVNTQILKLKKGKNASNGLMADDSTQIPSVAYSDKWPWVKKIKFAIKIQGRPLSTKEIVDTLIEHEIGLMFDRKKAVASISSMLSTKSGENKEFQKVESESGDFAYDLNSNKADTDAQEEEASNLFD